MLPTVITALSAAQLAHVFKNGADFHMTSIQDGKRTHPSISLRLSLEMASAKRTLALQPDRENTYIQS